MLKLQNDNRFYYSNTESQQALQDLSTFYKKTKNYNNSFIKFSLIIKKNFHVFNNFFHFTKLIKSKNNFITKSISLLEKRGFCSDHKNLYLICDINNFIIQKNII